MRAARWAPRAGLTADLLHRHLHEVAEGQLQRTCLARAPVCRPDHLVGDEPTSMLDVSPQLALLHTNAELQQETGLAVLLNTDDQILADHWCGEVVRMRSARISSPPGTVS